jgi:small subunit ribosomal protein S6
MPLYETTFIVRQDVLSHEVEKLADQFSAIITAAKGKIIKTENWGLRDLAYPIKKFAKGYYVHLLIESPIEAVKEMERKISLNEDVVRCLTFKIDSIPEGPSALIAPDEEGEEIVIGGNHRDKGDARHEK